MNSGSQEPPPSGHRYDVRSATNQFEAKRAEIKLFARDGLDVRARALLPARSAPRPLLAVSCPVSEYDRLPGMIGEKATRMILAAETQTLRHRILGGGNRWHRHYSKAPARIPMSRLSR